MKSFGEIKTSVEKSLVKNYGKSSFKSLMKEFKKNILDDKQISEMYFLYDALSKPSGFNKEYVGDYVNESTDVLKDLIQKNTEKLERLSAWVESMIQLDENEYKNIDTIVYNKSVKNLDKVIESKNVIKSLLITEKKEVVKESVSIPLSSMLKIASNVFNEKYENISEEEKNELKSLLGLTKEETKQQVKELTEDVVGKLQNKLNEEEDSEVKVMIETTISKVQESKEDLVSLYKLKQLYSGL
jgi:hypothetical protein